MKKSPPHTSPPKHSMRQAAWLGDEKEKRFWNVRIESEKKKKPLWEVFKMEKQGRHQQDLLFCFLTGKPCGLPALRFSGGYRGVLFSKSTPLKTSSQAGRISCNAAGRMAIRGLRIVTISPSIFISSGFSDRICIEVTRLRTICFASLSKYVPLR